ncbi:MAG: hypothetical protein M1838_006046 [Thelocarpon superellum]|nr:MAG: hypothetical protein M1838_006046 [Thelocarpon superellum]
MPSDDPSSSSPSPSTNARSHDASSGKDQGVSNIPAMLPAYQAPFTRLEILSTRMSNPVVNSISGAIGGLASGIVTCPLDVIKTKLQAQGGFQTSKSDLGASSATAYRGLVGTAGSIWREEGVRGMYRGLFPIILGYFPTWAVYFTVYDSSKEYWYGKLGEDEPTTRSNKTLSQFLASLTAGACSTMITNPIWVIKTRLMSQVNAQNHRGVRPPWQYKSTWDAARKMYQHEGILSFYSGLTPALLGLTHVAVQFPLYEYLKFKFTGLEMGEKGEGKDHPSWVGMSVATVVSKVCASSATYPHEVLRTRLQTQQRSVPVTSPEGLSFRGGMDKPLQRIVGGASPSPPRYRGVIRTFKTILREEGWRAFYSGMGTNMLRAVPAATTTILTYEFVVGRIRKMQAEGHRQLSSLDEQGY